MLNWLIGKQDNLNEDMEHKFFDIFDKDICPMFICDTKCTFIKANKPALKLYGFSNKEFSFDLFTKSKFFETISTKKKCIISKGEEIFNFNDFKKDGTEINVKMHSYIINITNYDLIFSILEDISDKKTVALDVDIFNDKNVFVKMAETATALIELKAPYIVKHQKRVVNIACKIAEEMKLSSDQCFKIYISSMLHDIGNISIPSEILLKPNSLNTDEYNMIKKHCEIAYNILKKIGFPSDICNIVLQHHERINGSGYPNGLSSENIQIEARILAVADVIDAMLSQRPHRSKLDLKLVIEEISNNKNILYDADVVDTCIKILSLEDFDYKNYSYKYPEINKELV